MKISSSSVKIDTNVIQITNKEIPSNENDIEKIIFNILSDVFYEDKISISEEEKSVSII